MSYNDLITVRTFNMSNSPLSTIKKIKNLRSGLNFKGVEGWYHLQEVKVMQNSGYALFTSEDKEVYFTVINCRGRKAVATELVSNILNKTHWTSIIDIGRSYEHTKRHIKNK